MPRLSIVIPLVRSTELLESTLVSVLENRPDDCEIIVVLNTDYGDPYLLRGEVEFVQARRGASLAECARAGIEAARSPIVHLLASGVEATEGWAEAALVHFEDRRVAAVSPVLLDAIDTSRVVANGIGYRPWGERKLEFKPGKLAGVIGPTALGAFYRKSAVEVIGGWPVEMGDQMADADVAMALKFAGYRVACEPDCRLHLVRTEVAAPGVLRKAMLAERLFWRNAAVTGWVPSLLTHPLAIAGECLLNIYRPAVLAMIAGRLWGFCQLGSHRRRLGSLNDAKVAAASLQSGRLPDAWRIDSSHPTVRSDARESRVGRELV